MKYWNTLNKAQQQALWAVFMRNHEFYPIEPAARRREYRAFRRTVQFSFDCVMVPWAGMWLGIERDGYTHS